MNLLVFFLTMSVHYFLALLNVGGVHNPRALLVLLFLGDLVALLILLVVTLRPRGVAMVGRISLSFTLMMTMTIRVMMNNMRVMSNHMRAMMDLSMFLLAMSMGDILALLNISSIYNMFTFIMFLMLGDLVTLVVFLVITMRTTGVTMFTRVSITLDRSD